MSYIVLKQYANGSYQAVGGPPKYATEDEALKAAEESMSKTTDGKAEAFVVFKAIARAELRPQPVRVVYLEKTDVNWPKQVG